MRGFQWPPHSPLPHHPDQGRTGQGGRARYVLDQTRRPLSACPLRLTRGGFAGA